MFNRRNMTALGCSLMLATSTAPAAESSMARLLKPTFEELQAEFVFGEVTTYVGLSDTTIDQALDRQFHRIEFMRFVNSAEEECE